MIRLNKPEFGGEVCFRLSQSCSEDCGGRIAILGVNPCDPVGQGTVCLSNPENGPGPLIQKKCSAAHMVGEAPGLRPLQGIGQTLPGFEHDLLGPFQFGHLLLDAGIGQFQIEGTVPHDFLEVILVTSQILFDTNAFANIDGNTQQVGRLILLAEQTYLEGLQDLRGAVTTADGFLGNLPDCTAVQDFPIGLDELIRLFRSEEVIIIFAQQVVAIVSQHPFAGLVEQLKTQVRGPL